MPPSNLKFSMFSITVPGDWAQSIFLYSCGFRQREMHTTRVDKAGKIRLLVSSSFCTAELSLSDILSATCLSVCLSVCLPVCLPACLSACIRVLSLPLATFCSFYIFSSSYIHSRWLPTRKTGSTWPFQSKSKSVFLTEILARWICVLCLQLSSV